MREKRTDRFSDNISRDRGKHPNPKEGFASGSYPKKK
jgi:hypothetical protein